MELVVGAVLVLVAVVAFATVAAERWARTRGLDRAAAHLGTRLGLVRPVGLSVAARPLLPALLRDGTVAELVADDVPIGDDGRLRRLTVTLSDVRLRPSRRELVTGPGRFAATVDERELDRIVPLPTAVSRVELRADGLRVWTVLGVPLDTEVLVTEGALRVVPDPAQLAAVAQLPGLSAVRRAVDGRGLQLPLPPLPLGAVVEAVTFDAGVAYVTGRVPPRDIPFGRGEEG